MHIKRSFIALALVFASVLAGGSSAFSPENQVTSREETAQPVAGSGYILIPAEYSYQLEDVDADSTFLSLLEQAVRSGEHLRLTFQPSMGCESLNCKDASHSHFCKAKCVNEAHCHR